MKMVNSTITKVVVTVWEKKECSTKTWLCEKRKNVPQRNSPKTKMSTAPWPKSSGLCKLHTKCLVNCVLYDCVNTVWTHKRTWVSTHTFTAHWSTQMHWTQLTKHFTTRLAVDWTFYNPLYYTLLTKHITALQPALPHTIPSGTH